MILNVVKVFGPSTVAFFIGLSITPILTHYLYKHKAWKKKSVQKALGGGDTPISASLHRDEVKKTPRMGGIVIWVSALLTIAVIWIISQMFPSPLSQKLNFLSRNQTWLPLFTLVIASLIGLVDDVLQVNGNGGYIGGGLSLKKRILLVASIGMVGALWFFIHLSTQISIPFFGLYDLGILFIPFFILVMLALFSGGVIDGIDGLSGGVMAAIFSAYAGIAFFQNQIDLAAFCAVVVGGTLAFLWFNIPPARFYMSETGILGLTTSLTVVAFLTRQVVVLPIIALPLFVSSGSVIIQILSKKFRKGKKIFLVAPLHHHFEALGWPSYKVTMRFWILSIIFAMLGLVIALVGNIV
ncbi:MAG: MraY family glycosyltransferase [Minisyncoccota bacterium]